MLVNWHVGETAGICYAKWILSWFVLWNSQIKIIKLILWFLEYETSNTTNGLLLKGLELLISLECWLFYYI